MAITKYTRFAVYDELSERYVGDGRIYGIGELIDFANELLDASLSHPVRIETLAERREVFELNNYRLLEASIYEHLKANCRA